MPHSRRTTSATDRSATGSRSCRRIRQARACSHVTFAITAGRPTRDLAFGIQQLEVTGEGLRGDVGVDQGAYLALLVEKVDRVAVADTARRRIGLDANAVRRPDRLQLGRSADEEDEARREAVVSREALHCFRRVLTRIDRHGDEERALTLVVGESL